MRGAYQVGRIAARILCAPLFRLSVEGRENVPRRGRLIVAANHSSYLDPVVLGSVFPRSIRFLMQKRVYNHWSVHALCRAVGTIPVDLDRPADIGALKRSLRVLEGDEVLGIFPEGHRSPDGELKAFEKGIVRLSRRSGAPVVPSAIVGSHRALPLGRAFPRFTKITVRFASPFSPPNDGEEEAFLHRLRESIGELMRGESLLPP